MTHQKLRQGERILVKIGTESLFHGENGMFGGEKVETICADIADIMKNSLDRVLLISS